MVRSSRMLPPLGMQNFRILFMCSFGPTPDTTLPDSRRFVCRKILVQVKAIGSKFIDHKSDLVPVMSSGCAAFDLRRKVSRCNFGLLHSHVAHLWPVEVGAVANCVYPL